MGNWLKVRGLKIAVRMNAHSGQRGNMLVLNPSIPCMTVYFTHDDDFLGGAIRFFTGGDVNHAGGFIYKQGTTSLVCAEEEARGVTEDNPSEYTQSLKSSIKYGYYWHGWDDPDKRQAAQIEIYNLIKSHGPASRYNYAAIAAEIPVVGLAFQWAWNLPEKICSQFWAYILMKYGCSWLTTDRLNPEQLKNAMNQAALTTLEPKQMVSCVQNIYL